MTILIRVTGDYCAFDGLNTDGVVKCGASGFVSSEDYVKAWDRIYGLNHPERSGDIILIFRDLTKDEAKIRYTCGTACKSWHGSLNPSDSYVPLILTYPGGNRYEIDKIVGRDDVCKADYSKCSDNWRTTDIIKGLTLQQYSK